MTPSNQHSAEAEAFARTELGMADDEPNEATGITTRLLFQKAAYIFDRGRTSAPVSTITDRETLARTGFATPERTAMIEAAVKSIERNFVNETQAWNVWNNLNTTPEFVAAILDLHAPSVPLVSTREVIAAVIEIAMSDYEANGFVLSRGEFSEIAADALLSSDVLVDRGESDAPSTTEIFDSFMAGAQYVEDQHGGPYCQICVEEEWMREAATEHLKASIAARLRSGKAEA